MPTTTWAVARADVTRPLGLVTAATTTNVTGSDTNLVSTTLTNKYPDDDTFNSWFAMITVDSDGGTPANAGALRRVTNYTGSSGTVALAGANLSAEDEAVEFVLMRFPPDRVQEHFNRARQHPILESVAAIVRDIDTIITGQRQITYTLPTTIRNRPIQLQQARRRTASSVAENEITDPSFEDWTSATALNSWSISGTNATVNRESHSTGPKNYMVLDGQFSARVLTASSGETTLLQTVTPTVSTQGVEVNLSVWVYCNTSGRVSLRIASSDGSTHGGTGWERLVHTANIADADATTTISIGLAATAGSAISFYTDEIVMVLGQSEIIEESFTPILNWEWMAPVAGASDGGKIRFPGHLEEQTMLRIIARDLLSSVSAETDTIEIDAQRLEALYDKTRELICEEAGITGPKSEREFWIGLQRHWAGRFREDLAAVSSSTPSPRLNVPDWGTGGRRTRQAIQDPGI